MKTFVPGSKFVPGKVLIGPKIIDGNYYRIVSQRDRSGRIEVFDRTLRGWTAAPEDIAFIDVWRAPDAAQLIVDLACAAPDEADEIPEESPEAPLIGPAEAGERAGAAGAP